MAAILKQLFSKYLILTNTVTSGTLLGLGDVITQNLEIEYASRMGNTSHDYDVRRTGRMFLMGLMIGPLGHFWYTKLADKLVLGTGPKVVLKKIGVDQIIFTPIITCIFFGSIGQNPFISMMTSPYAREILKRDVQQYILRTFVSSVLCEVSCRGAHGFSTVQQGMGLLEGKDVKGAVNEIKNNFIAVYSVDCCVWPPAQYINFHLIPARFRSVYVSSMTLCWNTFLSYMKHRGMTTE